MTRMLRNGHSLPCRLPLVILACCLIFPVFSQGDSQKEVVYIDSVLAVINGRVMTIYDVISESKLQEESEVHKYTKEQLKDPEIIKKISSEAEKIRTVIADKLLEEYLVYAEFQRQGYQLPQAAIDERVHKVAARVANGDMEKFRLQLKVSGLTMAEFRQRTRRKLAVDILLRQEVYDRIIIAPTKIEAYYKLNQKKFYSKPEVLLSLLMISAETKEALLEKKAEVEKALSSGQSFIEAVQAFSIGPNNDTGGDMGWAVVTQQKKAVQHALKTMEIGDTSPAIIDGTTCYWIRLRDRKPGGTLPLDAVRDRIRNELSKEQQESYYQDYIRRLLSRSYVRKYY